MAINPQTAAIIGGGAFGAYTSDISENPVSGVLTTAIGAGMGAFMKLPESSFKDMSKVAVGPSVDMNLVNERAINANQPPEDFISNFRNRVNSLSSVLSYNERKAKINSTFDRYSQSVTERIGNEISRNTDKTNAYYDRKINKITEQIRSRNADLEDILKIKTQNRVNSFYNRMTSREEKELHSYLSSAKGKKEVEAYDRWIELKKKSNKHLIGRDSLELKEELLNQYMKTNPKAFTRLRAINEKYDLRGIKDKRDLFNPWHFDTLSSENATLEGRIRDNETYLQTEINRLNKSREASLNFKSGEVSKYYQDELSNELRLKEERLLKLDQKFDKRFNLMDSIYKTITDAGVTLDKNHEAIIDFLNTSTNENLLTKIDDLITKPNLQYVNIGTSKIEKFKSNSKIIKGEDGLENLSKWFVNILGNNIEDANIKAKMFLDRAVGGSVSLEDGTISFYDSADNKKVSVPLTSYSNEVRYHNQGKGVYSIAKQFNPYGLGYLGGGEVKIGNELRKLTAQDVVKGYDPEMMISFLDKNTPISSIVDNIKSLFHYDSKDTGVRFGGSSSDFITKSDAVLNKQGYVDLTYGLNFNEYGDINPQYPFRKMKTEASEGIASERVRLLRDKLGMELPPEMAGHMFDGVSMNDLNTINTKGFDSFAAFAPLERNETGVGNRDTTVVSKNQYTRGLESLLGSERFNKQFSSSQVVQKLDVRDSNLFNELVSKMYGNDYVLSDGGGFFNMGMDDFRIKDTSTIKIPLIGSSDLKINHPELAMGLRSQQGIAEYVKNNPININNEPIAYDNLGNPIALKNQYNSGKIVDAYSAGSDLRLVVESEFNPNMEREMKFFSTGTKSLNTGVTSNTFNVMSEIGRMLNEGAIKRNSQGFITLNGKFTDNVNDIKLMAQQRVNEAQRLNTFLPVSLIGAAEDTGTSVIMDAVEGGLRGNSIYDALIKQGGSKEVSALTALMFTENKAAIDLTTTVATGLSRFGEQFDSAIAAATLGDIDRDDILVKNLISSGFLTTDKSQISLVDLQHQREAFNKNFLQTFNASSFLKAGMTTPFLRNAYNLVEKSGASSTYKSGIGFAVGSMNKGMSIVGAGNRAGMSWNARSNLMSSGFTNSDLSKFGNKAEDLLYEVRSVMSERSRASHSINGIINNMETHFLGLIQNTPKAENRLNSLSKMGTITEEIANNPFLSYNLAYSDHSIKSINFSRISTKRSGMFEKGSGIGFMLKDLDRYKSDVIQADVAYRNSKTKEERESTKKAVVSALDAYDSHVKAMFAGDNNLLKSALSLESKHSDIMQVKGIGGNAERFANKMMSKENGYQNIWFVSEDEAHHKAKQIGGSLVFKDVEGYDNIKQPFIVKGKEEIPLASLLTREPAQGPLSSDLVQWYVDKSIAKGNRGNAFVANSSFIYSKGMFGDMDQDTVQTLLGNFNTRAEFDAMNKKRAGVRETFVGMKGILEGMKIKNSNKTQKTLADFNGNALEFVNYRIASALKGRNRKTLAAASTGLAVAYSKALEFEFGSLGPNNAKLLEGRIVGHQLIENLLKSAHSDTASFGKEQEQAVEKLNRLRNGYLGKPKYTAITGKEYEQGLREELPKFLNLNGIKSEADKTKLSGIIDNMITAELNHSIKVGRNPLTPLDLPEHRFSKNSNDYIDAIGNIIKEGNITNIDYEDASKHLRKASGQVYSGISDLVLDTFKNNKMMIAGGLGAMAGVAMLSRQEPQFTDSRSSARQHAATMLRSSGEYDAPSQNNTPMGQETNSNKSGYITPKTFNSKGVRISGDFVSDSEEQYNNFSSMISVDNVENQIYNMSNSIFGDGIRSARLQTNN